MKVNDKTHLYQHEKTRSRRRGTAFHPLSQRKEVELDLRASLGRRNTCLGTIRVKNRAAR